MMTNFLLQMGGVMDTDPTKGSFADDVKIGMQLWLNSLFQEATSLFRRIRPAASIHRSSSTWPKLQLTAPSSFHK